MAGTKYSSLIKKGRVFHNMREVDEAFMQANRVATENTLETMKKKLHEFIEQDVYNNVHTSTNSAAREIYGNRYRYQSKWGGRTNSLLDERTIETYIYNAFGKGVGGGIRLNDVAYDEATDLDKFIHGNRYSGMLAFSSYLEMLNNSKSMLVENPYHFPTGAELYRQPFWNDFREWVAYNYEKIFAEKLRLALGGKAVATTSNPTKNTSMNLSSSTSQYSSRDTGKTALAKTPKKY